VNYNRKKYKVITGLGEKGRNYVLSSVPYRLSDTENNISLEKAVSDENAHIVVLK